MVSLKGKSINAETGPYRDPHVASNIPFPFQLSQPPSLKWDQISSAISRAVFTPPSWRRILVGGSVRLTLFGFFFFFNGIHWLFPLLNGGLCRAGCGGEMFPSSGGRTDPGGGFRPRAGVMVPLRKLPQELGPHSPSTLANTACSCSSLFNALLTKRANTGAFAAVLFIRWVVRSLAAAGNPVEWNCLCYLHPQASLIQLSHCLPPER